MDKLDKLLHNNIFQIVVSAFLGIYSAYRFHAAHAGIPLCLVMLLGCGVGSLAYLTMHENSK
jgi:uncharacterized membrane protein YfcA